jgi:hypothetical protein
MLQLRALVLVPIGRNETPLLSKPVAANSSDFDRRFRTVREMMTLIEL